MTRTPLIAANWKMNMAPVGSLVTGSPFFPRPGVDTLVFPAFTELMACIAAGLLVGAQCGHPESKGAHTGDISMEMLARLGCKSVLCGHSERRKDHAESDSMVGSQAEAAVRMGMHPIVCIGETLAERETHRQKKVVERQIKAIPLHLTLTIAYEPVWAIGTGVTATPDQAQDMHAFIRSLLPEKSRASTRILYGGSMNPTNAESLLMQPDIDGGLIGGASLKPDEFRAIVEIAGRVGVK